MMKQASLAARSNTPQRTSRRALIRNAGLLAATLVATRALPAGAAATEAPPISVDALFRSFVVRFGGTAFFGAPLTASFVHNGRTAQLFENFVLARWPEHADTTYEVQPELLGETASGQRYFEQIRAFRSEDQVVYFPQTRHSLRFGFLQYWKDHGGLDVFGYPISEEVPDAGIVAQWFQRAKLTYDPERAQPVQLADLGRQWLEQTTGGMAADYVVESTPPVGPGAAASMRLTVTNKGTVTWPAEGEDAVTLGLRWADAYVPRERPLTGEVALAQDVAPGASAVLEAQVTLPQHPGMFRVQPDLRQRGGWFTKHGVAAPIAEVPAQLGTPQIRIGLLDISDDNPTVNQATVSSTGGMTIRDEGGHVMAELEAGRAATIRRSVADEHQIVTFPDGSSDATVGRVLIAPSYGSLLQLEETAPWRTYHGSMEFVWLPKYSAAWMIGVMPMDDYLAGIAEQHASIPWEALRASTVAYRSYAHVLRQSRRASGLVFDAAASTRHTPTFVALHQVFHGVAQESPDGRLRAAVKDTRGMVLTYDDETIMSVYFSRADGRTRSWHDVWGGSPKPWAQGVPDPYSEGQRLWGHGIGLPLQSVNAMAADGADAEHILTSYYSNVDFGFIY